MTAQLLAVAGGVGLFLYGMTAMTDALRALAGPALRRWLGRVTRTPASGAAAGALATAVVQSSSATALMAVGFAGAGLLTFPQALGVVFGANLGTTATGWIVALLGFKLELGAAALPLMFLGALGATFGEGALRQAGRALAGFSLLFIGIGLLQEGMAGVEGALSPERFPPDTLLGRLTLIGLGAGITVITQSSSAGVAAALAAIGAGSISFEQGAAMVIGMDIGTTLKSLLAVIGGSTAMRRTGLAHVVYNLITAVFALAILDPFTAAAEALAGDGTVGDPQIALVAFHSTFNGLGVVLALPFAGPFARLIERLAPDRPPRLAARLDPGLLADPDGAAEAACDTAATLRDALADAVAAALTGRRRRVDPRVIEEAETAAALARDYAERIEAGSATARARRIAALHALDHVDRLAARARQAERLDALRDDRRLRRLARLLAAGLGGKRADALWLDRLRGLMRRRRRGYRETMLQEAADGRIDVELALDRTDAMRWLHRTSYHLWRIAARLAPDAAPARAETTLEAREDL